MRTAPELKDACQGQGLLGIAVVLNLGRQAQQPYRSRSRHASLVSIDAGSALAVVVDAQLFSPIKHKGLSVALQYYAGNLPI